MKAFIRKLNINERKGYMHSIIYSIFFGFHILITKFILYKLHFHYLFLLSLSGSLLILMSFYRIFRSIKKCKFKDKILYQNNWSDGFYSFIAYAGLLISLNWTSLTNVILTNRLFPFIFMFSSLISKSKSIPTYYLYCFCAYLLCIIFIFFPLLKTDQAPGIIICIISEIFRFVANKTSSQVKGIKIDILILNIGFYSVYVGGIIMVIIYDKMEHISKLLWLLIIINTFNTYVMKIFLNKLIKNNNNQKLLICNLLILAFSIPIDFFLFNEKFSFNYFALIFLSIDIFFFYKKVIKSKGNYLYNY